MAERSLSEEDECSEVRGRIALSRALNGLYSCISAAYFRLSVDMLVDAH